MASAAHSNDLEQANTHDVDSGDSRQAFELRNHGLETSKKTGLEWAKQLWAKTGITLQVAKLMLKGALSPTIAIAAFQSDAWASQFSTIGYLIAVMTQLSVVIQPRAKFLQTMLVQILITCVGACLALLACFSAVHARLDSTGISDPGNGGPGTSGTPTQGASTTTYSSSASAVAGVWLFVEIYGISTFRAYFPQYAVPCIMFAIFANISSTYAPQFNTMAQAEAFCLSLIYAFLTGFAIASGVSLLIFPVTSRELFFNDTSSFITGLQDCLGANMNYLISLQSTDMFAAVKTNSSGRKPPNRSPEAEAFQEKMKDVSAVHSKCAGNLVFAKREVALGKLGPDDLQEVFKLLREISVPMIGLSSLSEIFRRISQESGWDRSQSFAGVNLAEAVNTAEKTRIESINEWHELMSLLKEPFGTVTKIIDEGLEHASITLQLKKRERVAKREEDEEAVRDCPKPGDQDFAQYLERRTEDFNKSKQLLLRGWTRVHGIDLPEDYFDNPNPPFFKMPRHMNEATSPERVRLRRQLMVLLYVEAMLYILAKRTSRLVRHSDSLVKSGKLSSTRLIVPGIKRLRKWLLSTIRQEDMDRDHYSDSFTVSLGQAYHGRKNPEHLPPQNAWEKYTNIFRTIGNFFGSSESFFGFRSAVATMSIGVINLLSPTQIFFTRERLFWAQIMTSIAMTPSAGQSLRTFFLRIAGTTLAMQGDSLDTSRGLANGGGSIVDGHTAGVLIFYYIFQLPGLYIMTTRPAILPVGLISTVTLSLILGYALQVDKIGLEQAQSNGQIYHPVYELAPIRLLTVCAGLFVAFIFTIFPYPVTEHAQLRQNTAKSLYLLASYYSAVTETVNLRLKGGREADETIKGSPAQKLAKARLKVFSKCNLLLAEMRKQASFVKYDIPCGGRFPKSKYQGLIEKVQSVLSFMSLVSVASSNFLSMQEEDEKDSRYLWLRNLRKLADGSNHASESVTTLLSLLSASLAHGQPVPPYLHIPAPYALAEQLEDMDSELLSIQHIVEPGYASFAVVQIGTTCMIDDLADILSVVTDLLGEMDFSIATQDSHKED